MISPCFALALCAGSADQCTTVPGPGPLARGSLPGLFSAQNVTHDTSRPACGLFRREHGTSSRERDRPSARRLTGDADKRLGSLRRPQLAPRGPRLGSMVRPLLNMKPRAATLGYGPAKRDASPVKSAISLMLKAVLARIRRPPIRQSFRQNPRQRGPQSAS
jgi:hypothetical protein